MADIKKLKGDVKWWEDELRLREGKVAEAERMLSQRQNELQAAEREEASKKK